MGWEIGIGPHEAEAAAWDGCAVCTICVTADVKKESDLQDAMCTCE
jgi:hypothetical protein